MSYFVRLEVEWGGNLDKPPSRKLREQVISCVEEYLGTDGDYEADEWLDEFRNAFDGKPAEIKSMGEEWAIGLFTFLSRRFPGVAFETRGNGEEFEDTWAFRCQDGELLWEASFSGERAGSVRDNLPLSAWPKPLDVSRVVSEAGSRSFIAEILDGQPSTAQVAALTIKPSRKKQPRCLVYVGPLDQDGYERVRDLIDDHYDVKQFRNVKSLLKDPTATADDPLGY